MKNRRMVEFLVVLLLICIGTPIFLLLGFRDGESFAAKAYGKVKTADSDTAGLGIFQPNPAVISQGYDLFQQKCSACHDEDEDGKGPMAAGMIPAPTNFTDSTVKWERSREPQDIFKTVSEGGPEAAMPAFKDSLTLQERWALVHYIGTLPGVQNQFHPIDPDLAKQLAQQEKP